MTQNFPEVYLHLLGEDLVLSFETNPLLYDLAKQIYGSKINHQLKRWMCPLIAYEQIINTFPNLKISKGVIEKLQIEAALQRKVDEIKKAEYWELDGYSPKLPLMTHQKKAFELHRFLDGSNNFSEMGSGKCRIDKDLCQINGLLITAEDTWDKFANNPVSDGEGWWALTKEPLYVASLGSDGKINKRLVKRLYRQQVKEIVRKIILDDGSQTIITKAHKLYKKDTWTNNLKIGDYVCVPRYLPQESGDLDPDIAELFGWMVGDGCERSSKYAHRFTQKDDNDRHRFADLASKICTKYNIPVQIKEYIPQTSYRAGDITIRSKEFTEFCQNLGYKWGELSANKRVPTSVMHAKPEAVIRFLRAFFDAEGAITVNKNIIEICSASQMMLKEVNTLLRRFGIWLRTRKKRARATNGKNIWRDYWSGTIGGPAARLFNEKIKFSVISKQYNLEQVCQKKANTNVEGIPASANVSNIINYTKLPIRHLTGPNTVYARGTQEFSRHSLKGVIDKINNILSGKKKHEMLMTVAAGGTGSASNIKFFPIYDALDIEWLTSERNKLQKLIDQEVHYAFIKDIQEFEYDGWVYDFEVEEDHNYVAENILCHNTASAICAIHWRLIMNHIDRALVICPLSAVKSGWEEQIDMFSDLTHTNLIGTKDQRLKKLVLDRNVYIINYEGARLLVDELLAKNFQMVICDEAQAIKNPLSKQSQACYVLGGNAKYRIALTGTPIGNTSMDAFGIQKFTSPKIFGPSFYAFRNKYFKNLSANNNSPIPIYVPKHGAEQEISDKLYSNSVRILKDEALELPPAIFQPSCIIPMTPDQDMAYEKMQKELLVELGEQKKVKVTHILTALMKLSQICSGWVKVPESQEVRYFNPNPKLEQLKELLNNDIKTSTIIWAHYKIDMRAIYDYFSHCHKCRTYTNDIVEKDCPKCNEPILHRASIVAGFVKNRDIEISRFRFSPAERAEMRAKRLGTGESAKLIAKDLGNLLSDGPELPQTNIFCGQLKAAGAALNLQIAQHAVFFGRDWSLLNWMQALARNHRAGTKHTVLYHNLLCCRLDGSDTVDQRILTALKRKENLAQKINKDDIKMMLGNYKKVDREALKAIDNMEIDFDVDEKLLEIGEPEANEPQIVEHMDAVVNTQENDTLKQRKLF